MQTIILESKATIPYQHLKAHFQKKRKKDSSNISVKNIGTAKYQLSPVFFIVDMKYHFTYGELKLFENVAKFQDIKSSIVG